MKVILDVPDTTMAVGAFINYRRKADGEHNFTSTNCLIDCSLYEGVKINDNAELTYLTKKVKTKSKEVKEAET